LDALDENAVVERSDLHGRFSLFRIAVRRRPSGGSLRLLGGFGGLVGGARGGRCLFARGVLRRPLALGAVGLGTGVQVRVPAAALEAEGCLADELLDLLRLALRTDLDR